MNIFSFGVGKTYLWWIIGKYHIYILSPVTMYKDVELLRRIISTGGTVFLIVFFMALEQVSGLLGRCGELQSTSRFRGICFLTNLASITGPQ